MTGVAAMADGTPRRTASLGLLVRLVARLPRYALPLFAAAYAVVLGGAATQLRTLVLIFAIGPVFALLRWWRLTYAVGETDISVESGIFSRSARSVPYDRIQDVSLQQGPIARLLGLVEVTFDTGSGAKDELKLAFLSVEEGERLRALVRERHADGGAARAPVAIGGTESVATDGQAQPLFHMGPGRVMLFGLFQFSLAAVVLLLAFARQLADVLPIDRWERTVADSSAGMLHHSTGWQAVALLAGFAALLVLGIATGVVRTVLREWDFRLERTPRGFRRRRGLLTRTDLVMPIHRVQALAFTTGIVRRRFGWSGLLIISLAQDAGKANHAIAPFAQDAELAPIVRAAHFASPDPNTPWRRSSAAYHAMRAVRATLLLGVLLALVAIGLRLDGEDRAALSAVAVALWAFLMLRRYMLWRYHHHALDETQVYLRTGWLAPRTLVGNRIRQQSVEIAQGPLACRFGYARLVLGLAGGRFALDGVPLGDARRMRDAILASVAGTDFSELL